MLSKAVILKAPLSLISYVWRLTHFYMRFCKLSSAHKLLSKRCSIFSKYSASQFFSLPLKLMAAFALTEQLTLSFFGGVFNKRAILNILFNKDQFESFPNLFAKKFFCKE